MEQKIRRLMGRVDVRVVCLLLLLALIGSFAFAAVQLTKEQAEDFDARTLNTWAQLTKEFTAFRESSYPLVIPALLPDDSPVDWAASKTTTPNGIGTSMAGPTTSTPAAKFPSKSQTILNSLFLKTLPPKSFWR